MVNSFITIATEAQDHDGCPHVLEVIILSKNTKKLALDFSWQRRLPIQGYFGLTCQSLLRTR